MSGGALEKPDKIPPPPPPEKQAYLAIHEALRRKTPHVLEPFHEQQTTRAHERPQKAMPRLQRLSVRKPGSSQPSQEVIIDTEVYAEGTYKTACKGRFTAGPRNGQACVAKTFLKPKYGSFAEQWAGELRAVRTAQRIVEAWNDAGIIKEQLYVLVPEVMSSNDGGAREQRMVEPLIRDYEKNNNNAGWVNASPDPWNEVMQALSHFSYHATGGRRLLCDIQGGPVRGVYALTDPAVHSTTGDQFGPTDHGWEGFLKFFDTHCCNRFCRPSWLKADRLINLAPDPEPRAPEKGRPRWKASPRRGKVGI
ncbi:kinase-like domain-containing protein [Apiospora aurea]|uniref:Kinase-like domain-containing protein n=1 Tax=Apiospora aurea TaxID=335848 RepID=A0ABR1Q0M8_9PEZI